MAPKKQKTSENMKDIRSFFEKENDVAGSPFKTPRKNLQTGGKSQTPTQTPMRVKNENGSDSVVTHSHRFIVKFTPTERKEYTIDCDQPSTVLDAIRSSLGTTEKMIKYPDESIIIQLGKRDRESVVPTHFPCSCIGDGETVILYHYASEKIEKVQEQHDKTIHPKDHYSVFYIDTVGGLKTKTKELFRNKILKQFKFLCVYGVKGMTVEEALKQDGRFLDSLGEFKLSDNENPNRLTVRTQRVDSLHQKAFKIRLPLNKREGVENPTTSILDVARVSGRSVKKAMEQPGDSGCSTEEIYELLRKQFPELKEWMESRFPGDSYEKALNRGSEKFGKIQQSFSEVHRIKKLLVMGKSVCKINVYDICEGTGFVLFDRFVLTNAHLFRGCVQGKNLLDQINVYALFNYDEPVPETNYFYFSAEKTLIDIDMELDFAVLQLKPDGKKPNSKSKPDNVKVPPGLLDRFGPLPRNGEACLIGHPAGSVKKIDPTCIIEPEKREQAVKDHLSKYKVKKVILKKVNELKNQGIDDIMMGGEKAEKVASYNTFMYHGASGSPVFDAHGQIFGIHTGGYGMSDRIIEYAHPLLTIFEKFVINLKESGNDQMLEKVKEAATEKKHLKKILQDEPMEED
ncbi:protein FAM111B-like isoform X3 [Poecilia formosa]|uniref:protein FAM111B-like isoform X3 n=1 Tax=Poecilia formosa TaxID=48698 RepID=UPI0007BA6A1B|nr:PREDICTED: protein FAM111B-like isoform X3 [Poecilia formosa]